MTTPQESTDQAIKNLERLLPIFDPMGKAIGYILGLAATHYECTGRLPTLHQIDAAIDHIAYDLDDFDPPTRSASLSILEGMSDFLHRRDWFAFWDQLNASIANDDDPT